MFVQAQWLGSLQPCPPPLPMQPRAEGMALSPLCDCCSPTTHHPPFVRDSLFGHHLLSLFNLLQGGEYLQQLSVVFGQGHNMFLSLAFGSTVGSIKAVQVRSGAASNGLLQLEHLMGLLLARQR